MWATYSHAGGRVSHTGGWGWYAGGQLGGCGGVPPATTHHATTHQRKVVQRGQRWLPHLGRSSAQILSGLEQFTGSVTDTDQPVTRSEGGGRGLAGAG